MTVWLAFPIERVDQVDLRLNRDYPRGCAQGEAGAVQLTPIARFRVALLATLLFGVLIATFAGQAAAAPDPGKGLAELRAKIRAAISAQDLHTPDLLRISGVVGTGVGLGPDGEPEIKIFTTSATTGLPKRLENVRAKVEVTGPVVAEDCTNRTDRCVRPVPLGVSTGHPNITAGTIGALVEKDNQQYALSNNHVFADENAGQKNVDPVIQHGTFDGGSSPGDNLGTLTDFVEINWCQIIWIWLSCDQTNEVDAAIAAVAPGQVRPETHLSCGVFSPVSETRSMQSLTPGSTQVKKCGRTTGLTTGLVDAINVTVDVQYGSGVARFTNQIRIADGPGDFSAGGDSGSLIVDSQNRPVCLLYAGSPTSTFCNPIDPVLAAFGVTIVEQSAGGSPPTADFSGTPTSGDAPLTVNFTDLSGGSLTSRSWNFGDGNSSNATNPSHTYNNPGTYNVSLTVSNGDGSDTMTKNNYITVNAASSGEVQFYFSPQADVASIGNDEDIIAREASGNYRVVLDGSALGIGGEDIDAFAILDDGTYLLSSTSSVNVGGVSAADEDLLLYDPGNSEDPWSLFFDGSDVGLGGNSSEDIDAVSVLDSSTIVVSTVGSFSVDGASGADEDLIMFTGSFGANTSGSWELYFDGSDVGLGREDVSAAAVHVNGGTTTIHLSMKSGFNVGGVSGADEDIVVFSAASSDLGPSTNGDFVSPVMFDGSQNGFTNDIYALFIP